ncbi:MAG: SDR family NAD(P)-dependent oxidoreductase [Candidatus Binatia bacterium]
MTEEIALVTGASSGIGEALARRIARDGHAVGLVARRMDRLETLAAEIRSKHKVNAHVFGADLTQPTAVRAVTDAVAERGLVVDWLVNNAGFGTFGRFHEMPVGRELEEIRLNVEALVELTGRCTPGMVARGRGVVMNVSSVGGFVPSPYMATYTATKAFVLSFSEAIGAELAGTGVRVLCVCPGFTRTEFQSHVVGVDTTQVPGMAWQTADDVADEAVRAAARGGVLVNGVMNRVLTTVLKFVPRSVAIRSATMLLKPREG